MSSSNAKGSASNPTANAWSRPFQQRKNRTSSKSEPIAPPPGMGAGPKKGESGRTMDQMPENPGDLSDDGVSLQSVLRERFVQLSLSMVGQRVVISQTDGGVIEGVLHTFTPFASQPPHMRNKYVVKSCKRVVKGSILGTDETKLEPVSNGSTVIIPTELVSSVHVKSMRIDTGISNGKPTKSLENNEEKRAWSSGNRDLLRTDAEITVGRRGQDRDLVAAGSTWTSDVPPPSNSRAETLIGSLDEKGAAGRKGFLSSIGVGGGLQGNIGEWDQFKANEDLFDVRASFDENLYTTELDKSHIDCMEIRKAERLAKEIENTATSNIHVAEERGHVVQGDFDEEDRFSGVLASGPTSNSHHVEKEEDVPAVSDDCANKQATEKETNGSSSALVPATVTPAGTKMNYAAAAAKADVAKALPPGFGGVARSAGESGSLPTAGKKGARKEESSTPNHFNDANLDPTYPSERAAGSGGVVSEELVAAVAVEAGDAVVEEETEARNDETLKHSLSPGGTDEGAEKELGIDASSSSDGYPKKMTSKLNANAKSFTFNPGAKSFTPSSGVGADGGDLSSLASDSHVMEPNAPFSSAIGAASAPQMQMQHQHYIQFPGPMGQPGMMPMMSAHLNTTMRYQGASNQYPGMEQHTPPLQSHQQQTQHAQNLQPQGQEAATMNSTPGSVEDPSSQQQGQTQGRTTQLQGVPVPYNLPPAGGAGYYGAGMSLHPHARAQGSPHLGGGFHQLAGSSQQMPVVPGTAPYRHIYGTPSQLQQAGGMSSVAQMHVPGGASTYYSNAGSAVVGAGGIHYPSAPYIGHGHEDCSEPEYRSGGKGNGRGGGGRGGRRGSRKNGRGSGGRAGYYTAQNMQHHGGGSGRQTPQNNGIGGISASSVEAPDQTKGQSTSGQRDCPEEQGESNGESSISH